MFKIQFLPAATGAAVLALLLSAMFATSSGLAQDTGGTPMTGEGQPGGGPFPAHIHTGTCDAVGDIVFPLNDVTAAGAAATPVAANAATGAETSPAAGMTTGDVVAESTTMIESTIDELLAQPHVVNVHLSMEQIEVYIACGEIVDVGTGVTTSASGGRQLQIVLQEIDGSGYHGQATLSETADGTTEVTVQIMQGGMPTGSPAATPAG